jgi:hypothetical protein
VQEGGFRFVKPFKKEDFSTGIFPCSGLYYRVAVNIGKYERYAVEDFILDTDFVALCRQWPTADPMLWLKIEALFPDQAEKMRLAKDYLRETGVWDEVASAEQLGRIWKGIEAELFGVLSEKQRLNEATGAGGIVNAWEADRMDFFRVRHDGEERLPQKKIRSGAKVSKVWMRVAAAVLFLVVVSLITYYLSKFR